MQRKADCNRGDANRACLPAVRRPTCPSRRTAAATWYSPASVHDRLVVTLLSSELADRLRHLAERFDRRNGPCSLVVEGERSNRGIDWRGASGQGAVSASAACRLRRNRTHLLPGARHHPGDVRRGHAGVGHRRRSTAQPRRPDTDGLDWAAATDVFCLLAGGRDADASATDERTVGREVRCVVHVDGGRQTATGDGTCLGRGAAARASRRHYQCRRASSSPSLPIREPRTLKKPRRASARTWNGPSRWASRSAAST